MINSPDFSNLLINEISDPFFLVEYHQEGCSLVNTNHAFREIIRLPEEQLFLTHIKPLLQSAYTTQQDSLTAHFKSGENQHFLQLKKLHTAGGTDYLFSGRLTPVSQDHFYKKIAKHSLDILCCISEDGIIQSMNNASHAILGYLPDEMIGQSCAVFIHPEDLQRSWEIGLSIIAGEKTLDFNNRYCSKEGQTVHMNWSVDWNEEDRLLYCVGRNITASLHAEKLQRDSEKRFKALVQEGSDMIAVVNEEGQYMYASPTSSHILNIHPDEFIGKNAFDFIHPDDQEAVRNHLTRVFNEKRVAIPPFRFKHQDGSWRWVETILTNLLQDPDVEGIVANSRDITEKIIINETLQKSEQRFRALVQEGPDLCTVLDNDGNYKYVSPTYPIILGYKEEELLGRNAFDFIHPDDLNRLYAEFRKLETTQRVTSSPYRFLKKDGSWCWMRSVGSNLSKDPAVGGIVINTTEINDLVEAQQKIHEHNNRFAIIKKVSKEAIFEWDIASDTFQWGLGFQLNFGHDLDGAKFKLNDWIELMHPHDAARNQKNWELFLEDITQNKWVNEFRFRRENGQYAYVEEIGYLIRDADGRPTKMIGSLRDITETKISQLQRQIQHDISARFNEENSLQQILLSVLEYLTKNCNFDMAEVWLASTHNHHLHRISAYAASTESFGAIGCFNNQKQFDFGCGIPGQVWQKNSLMQWKEVELESIQSDIEVAAYKGLKEISGLPLTHNGKKIGVLVVGHTKLEPDQSTIALIEPLQSILGAEITRKVQEEEMRLLFESAPDILAIMSKEGYFTKVNPAFSRMMAYTERELTSRPFHEFLHPEDHAQRSDQRSRNFINRYQTKTGEERWISWSSSEPLSEDGLVFTYGRDITEMKRLQGLIESTSKLARVGSWQIDLQDYSIYCSEIAREIIDADPTETISIKNNRWLINGENWKTLKQLVREALFQQKSWDIEIELETLKGRAIWVRLIGQASFHNDRCINIYGSIQDIHDKKVAQIQLEKANRTINTILSSIQDGFYVLGKRWIVQYFNKEAEKLLGIPRQSVLGRNIWEVMPLQQQARLQESFQRALDLRHPVRFEEFYAPGNCWLEISAFPYDGGLTVYFKNITERKATLEKLKEVNDRYELVSAATNDAIWDWDIRNDRLSWNDGLRKVLGYQLRQLDGDTGFWKEMIHPDDYTALSKDIRQTIDQPGTFFWESEFRFRRSNGSFAYVVNRANIVRDEDGNAVRMVGALSDISQRKEYEDSLQNLNTELQRINTELARSNTELEQFAYIASHDLQEPLRMITSFLSQLERKYGPKLDETANRYIYFAVDGAKRMRGIILDLLEYSRVGRMNYQKEEVDSNLLIQEIRLLLRKQVEETGTEIICASLPVLNTYKIPLQQVFQNIISNAIKYSRPDVPPQIRISVKETCEHWEFSIEDNGIGIEKDFHAKIFVIFQRLLYKAEASGSGIGLAITKKIVEFLGGKIWVSSIVGSGSTFYFTIPKQ